MAKNQDVDYLAGVEWVTGKYINGSGSIGNGVTLKYTKNEIFLPAGEYVLTGTRDTGTSHIFRIHEYNANDQWVQQIEQQTFSSDVTNVEMRFTAPNAPNGVRLSLSNSFVGTLKKV